MPPFTTLASAAMIVVASVLALPDALAHGERNQEPFLRMRSAHWYDVKWSTAKVAVNDAVVLSGKVRIFDDWPSNLADPRTAFLGNGTPGPVFARTESYLNGIPMLQSTSLGKGQDYEFKTVLKARIPGRHHIHPMFNVEKVGALLGPGSFVEVSGSKADFKLPVTTLDGIRIDNLETWGTSTVYVWHALWIAIAGFWIFWWLRRPTFILRAAALEAGKENELVTPTDRKLAMAILVATVLLVYGGYQWADASFPRVIPLQAGKAVVEPLPQPEKTVKVQHVAATYDVPGRSLKINIKVTNPLDKPVQLGELTSANLRFVAKDVAAAVAGVDPGYPKELVADSGLAVSDNTPWQPGETRTVKVAATDAAWEVERLTAMLNDPDNRYGALLFFFDSDGKRHIASVSGPVIPMFIH
jgi:methane/ammonia monooxygenase subunit B